MKNNTHISLSTPNKPGSYFSFRLNQEITLEPSKYGRANRVFVVANLDGVFQSFCKLLMEYRIIDSHLRWSFDQGHFVILGFSFNMDHDYAECLWLIYSLEQQAYQTGGYVHFLLGTNEINYLNSDWRFKHPQYAKKKQDSRHPSTAIYSGNMELWRWLKTKNIIEKIGKILFVHGSVLPLLNKSFYSIKLINEHVRSYYSKDFKLLKDLIIQYSHNACEDDHSPTGDLSSSSNEEKVATYLKEFRASTIVTSHLIKKDCLCYTGTEMDLQGSIDSDESSGLLIKKHQIFKISINGKRERVL